MGVKKTLNQQQQNHSLQQPKPPGGQYAFHSRQIFALDSISVKPTAATCVKLINCLLLHILFVGELPFELKIWITIK